MEKLKFIVYDDDKKTAESFLETIEHALDKAKVPHDGTVQTQGNDIRILQERQNAARDGITSRAEPVDIDEARLLFVDYDLRWTTDAYGLTGEQVSYLARAFSTCGAIVGLNQFPPNTFDLTLIGRWNSWADVNVTEQDLHNPGLYHSAWSGFRPWSWPLLPRLAASAAALEEEFRTALAAGQTVGGFLGIPVAARNSLLPSHLDVLGSPEALLKDFARSHMPPKDRAIDDADVLARVGAARLRSKLEYFLAPGQDILVDLPHLASRYPSLVKPPRTLSRSWDALCYLEAKKAGVPPKLKATGTELRISHHLSRPFWWMPELRSRQVMPEDKEPWKFKESDFVFLEDEARFVKRSAARLFQAGTVGSNDSRYVAKKAQGIDFVPASRLLE